ncbi:MAG: hypothetical protein IT209_00635 [Armatimonadetes bacterium]|nr:hypothetical protein [Armatimonadota bacterium]
MSLRERLAKAEANTYSGENWTPQEEGDMICGFITDIKTVTSDHGEACVLTIADDVLGEMDVFCGRKSLAGQIHKLRPEVGEEIGIRYDGQYQTSFGTVGYNYTVVIDRNDRTAPKPQAKAAANPVKAAAEDDPFAGE